MSFTAKIKEKVKDGSLRDMLKECRWIYTYARSYRKAVIFYIAAGVAATIVSITGSLYLKELINAVTSYDMTGIKTVIAVIILTGVAGICLKSLSMRISAKINLKVNNEIQADVFGKILRTDWEHVSEYHSGDLLSRVNQDVSNVSGSVIGWIPSLITRLFQFAAVLCIILYFDPVMAVIALICAPVTFLLSRFLLKKMRAYNKKMRNVSSEMMAQNEEALQNIQNIKAFNIIDASVERLVAVQKKYMWVALDYNRFSVITSMYMSFAGLVTSYACFGWAVYRLWTGYIDIGVLVLFLQMASNLSGSFQALVSMVPQAVASATSAGRIMAIVELPAEDTGDKNAADCLGRNITVKISDADFAYSHSKTIIEKATIKAEPGQITALIGPSGEGKTTILRMLLALLKPQNGKLEIYDENGDGIPISSASRKLFSYVPQGNTIFSGTVADNMRLMKKDATEEEITEALKIACAWEFIEKLPDGINHPAGENGGGFSEGQAQRIAIARALLRKAPVLLLDEATSALDSDTEKRLLDNIRRRAEYCTCIVTTHRESVLSVCDKIYRIENKRVQQV